MKGAPTRPTLEAAALLGAQIRLARTRRKMTLAELAQRVGVTPTTIRKIEAGDPHVILAAAFDAAVVVGVELFGPDEGARRAERRRVEDQLALLPSRVRKREVSTDF
jgi:transcriptional regulator with XRE-family HTH domain